VITVTCDNCGEERTGPVWIMTGTSGNGFELKRTELLGKGWHLCHSSCVGKLLQTLVDPHAKTDIQIKREAERDALARGGK
jgi:hypothetical protein